MSILKPRNLLFAYLGSFQQGDTQMKRLCNYAVLTTFLICPVASGQQSPFIRGDANADGEVDVSDSIYLLLHLFGGGRENECREALDVTGEGSIDITDPIFLLDYLFRGGAQPPLPHVGCGVPPTYLFGCESFRPCRQSFMAEPAGASIELDGGVVLEVTPGAFARSTLVNLAHLEIPNPFFPAESSERLSVLRLEFDVLALGPLGEEAAFVLHATLPDGFTEIPIIAHTQGGDILLHAIAMSKGQGGGGAFSAYELKRRTLQTAKNVFMTGATFHKNAATAVITAAEGTGKVVARIGEKLHDGVVTVGENVLQPSLEVAGEVFEYVGSGIAGTVDLVLNGATLAGECIAQQSVLRQGLLYRWVEESDELSIVTGREASDRPSLVLIHGWIWNDNIPCFIPRSEGAVKQRLHQYFASLLSFIKDTRLGKSYSVYLFAYETTGSVAESAFHLSNHLQQVLDWENPDRRVAFICHSMGGLVASKAIARSRLPLVDTRMRVIALGSPFRGVPLANREFTRWLRSPAGEQVFQEALTNVWHALSPEQKVALKVPMLRSSIGLLAEILASSQGGADLDLDAQIQSLPPNSLSGILLRCAGQDCWDPIGDSSDLEFMETLYRVGASVAARYRDPASGTFPFGDSDGLVPLFSAWQRAGSLSEAGSTDGAMPGKDERILSCASHSQIINDSGRGSYSRVMEDLRSFFELPPTAEVSGFNHIGVNEQGLSEYLHVQTGIVFVRLPGGYYVRGSSEDCGDREGEVPAHVISVSSFLLAKREVTQEDWMRVMDSNPSAFQGAAVAPGVDQKSLPVESVTWDECDEFCRRTGLNLPTEAQWEFACRAGTVTPFCFGSLLSCETDANFYQRDDPCPASGDCRLPRIATEMVGSYRANAFGLHDVHGNVWEHCKDAWNPHFYELSEALGLDPLATGPSATHVARGGSYYDYASNCRSAGRGAVFADLRSSIIGFRPALSLASQD